MLIFFNSKSDISIYAHQFNNTPIVALMIPAVQDWGRLRSVSPSQLLMPMEFAVILGSLCSMIGSSSNLVIQGLLKDDRNFQFSFFAPFGIAFPVGMVCLFYMLVASPYLLPKDEDITTSKKNERSHVIELEISSPSCYVLQPLNEALAD